MHPALSQHSTLSLIHANPPVPSFFCGKQKGLAQWNPHVPGQLPVYWHLLSSLVRSSVLCDTKIRLSLPRRCCGLPWWSMPHHWNQPQSQHPGLKMSLEDLFNCVEHNCRFSGTMPLSKVSLLILDPVSNGSGSESCMCWSSTVKVPIEVPILNINGCSVRFIRWCLYLLCRLFIVGKFSCPREQKFLPATSHRRAVPVQGGIATLLVACILLIISRQCHYRLTLFHPPAALVGKV